MIKYFCYFLVFLSASCKSGIESAFVNNQNELWRVVQDGGSKSDSSESFFKIKADGSFDEFICSNGKYVQSDLHGDVKNYRKWKFVSDSAISFAHITYKIESVGDSVFLLVNQHNFSDTLKLVKHKMR